MEEISIGAKVECTDGPAGETTNLIFDPDSRKVTHYVVKEEASPHAERLVPSYLEVEGGPDLIKLSCTLAEFADMAPFSFEVAVNTMAPADTYAGSLAMRTYIVDKKQVPGGEMDLSLHSKVEATDGFVGRVDGLLAIEETGEVTHLLMHKGHAWGRKEVLIPIDLVDREHDNKVYLKVDKEEVSNLLSLPAAWGHDPSEGELEEALDSE